MYAGAHECALYAALVGRHSWRPINVLNCITYYGFDLFVLTHHCKTW